jgi:hypothetical protein
MHHPSRPKLGMPRMLGSALAAALLLGAPLAEAGIPECGDIRLEDVQSCDVRGNIQCEASCGDFGIYKKACATKLHKVCREECTLDAEPTCTDECTVPCQHECDIGVPITCIHNCFAECVGSCDGSCAEATDPEQCRAECEATCDGECDVQCGAVAVEATCYQHCIECCGGSCGAQANMTCQKTCQDEQFEQCEYELRVECDGSCSGDGALFCDGEYVLAADDIPACAQALIARGDIDVDLDVDVGGNGNLGLKDVGGGCAIGRATPAGGLLGSVYLFGLFALGRRVLRAFRRRG